LLFGAGTLLGVPAFLYVIRFKGGIMSKALKKGSVILIFLNLLSLVFFIVHVFTDFSSAAGNVFAAAAIAAACADMVYASCIKDRRAVFQMLITALLFVLNFASNYIAGLSAYTFSQNVIGIICLAAVYAVNIIFISAYIKKQKDYKINKWLEIAAFVLSFGLLLSFIAAGLVSLFAKTPINTNTVNLAPVFIILSVFAFSVFRYFNSGLKASEILKYAGAALCIAAIIPYAVTEAAAYKDADAARRSFEAAFGSEESEKYPYSFADEFSGVKTDGWQIKRDVAYYSADSGTDKGLTLRYDVYYPAAEDAHKSVLVNLHGSGGDKDTGNYAHRNKYFASLGYVVYDLQFGDWNEKDTGFAEEMYGAENMLFHIDEFFRYEVNGGNEYGADFSSVFITGVSMGGGLASKYAYSYPNNLDEYGVVLKGIIPVYPGYHPDDEGINNYLNYVDKDSVPCLVIMGRSDCIVRPETVGETLAAYEKADNPNCAAVEISYAGHGSDSLMSGRTNQLLSHYAACFMEKLK